MFATQPGYTNQKLIQQENMDRESQTVTSADRLTMSNYKRRDPDKVYEQNLKGIQRQIRYRKTSRENCRKVKELVNKATGKGQHWVVAATLQVSQITP